MSEIKVNLSLTLPGSVMLSEQECSKNPKYCYDNFFMKVCKDAKGKQKEIIHIKTRKSKPAKQNIKLSREAYDYMTAKDSYPTPKLKKEWEKFSVNQRLQYHCGQIAEALGAIGFTFEVFDD